MHAEVGTPEPTHAAKYSAVWLIAWGSPGMSRRKMAVK